MSRHPLYGLSLAVVGTLVLTPDAMLMRLSQMDGFQMVAWRGLLMGGMLLAAWALTSRDRAGDLRALRGGFGLTIVGCQFFNSILFCLGIAIAPVAVVLMGVAAVPVFAALMAWALFREATRPATWAAIVAVLGGIAIAVSGKMPGEVSLDLTSALGALCGLGVAMVLALNFVVLRARPGVPILLVIGCGALIAGSFGTLITGLEQIGQGRVWAMAATGAVILPVSFFSLSLAARHTQAANVSLVMLLETVLGPAWVWLVIHEAPTPRMLLGGAIVVVSLAVYLTLSARRARPPFPN